ncbi:MAG: magnesium/cobalt transporter CorA [Bacteroidales bacterium]|nr:magnesium/cobalt transporter CorA [Bacteroidales bacterium]
MKISKKLSFTKKIGEPPGSLTYTGESGKRSLKLELIQYSHDNLEIQVFNDLKPLSEKIRKDYVNWIHTNNLSDTTIIESIGNLFNIHTLTLEDILDTDHLPKIEQTDNYLFLTLKLIGLAENNAPTENHVSLVLGNNILLSFADSDEDIFNILKFRLESQKNKARTKNADYLFYLILDLLVDRYYIAFDKIYSDLENIENLLIEDFSLNRIRAIHNIKKKLSFLRKSLIPLEKSVILILKDEYDLIEDQNEIYFRDVWDHLIQLIQMHDSCREFVSSLLELNGTNLSNSMNQTMKILTVITTIFIPLTFIAGVYGMNFHHMPELSWKYGYFYVLLLMVIIVIFMMIVMKKKGFFK